MWCVNSTLYKQFIDNYAFLVNILAQDITYNQRAEITSQLILWNRKLIESNRVVIKHDSVLLGLVGARQRISCEWLIFWICTLLNDLFQPVLSLGQVLTKIWSWKRCDFYKQKFNNEHNTLCGKYILSFSRPACCQWEFGLVRFGGLAKLAHSTAYLLE